MKKKTLEVLYYSTDNDDDFSDIPDMFYFPKMLLWFSNMFIVKKIYILEMFGLKNSKVK